jgi:hypothetical protein
MIRRESIAASWFTQHEIEQIVLRPSGGKLTTIAQSFKFQISGPRLDFQLLVLSENTTVSDLPVHEHRPKTGDISEP